jgi:uncharacterized protein YdhG (YjbR/CyaY superfamily)
MVHDQFTPQTVDEYLQGLAPDVRRVMETIRATAREAAPAAQERISYRMPALFQDGVLVYFGAFKNHIGLFPPIKDARLAAAAKAYAGPKGNLQFPLNQPIPCALIRRIVASRLRGNQERKAAKAKK